MKNLMRPPLTPPLKRSGEFRGPPPCPPQNKFWEGKSRTMGTVIILLLFPILLFAQDQKVIDRVVAVVDDEIILDSEVFQYVQFAVGTQSAMDRLSEAEIDTLKERVLRDLIDQKILLAKAKLDSLTVPPKDVDKELDTRVKSLVDQAGGQDKLEEYYGMPLAKIKRQFRVLVEEGMLIEQVKQKKMATVSVSNSDVKSFWETYKDSIPELKDGVRIAHILLQDEVSEISKSAAMARADSARQAILDGKITFEDFAKQYSDDPGSAENGGKLGQTNRGDLVPEYEAVAYELKPGEISKPVMSAFGVHIIRLNERVGEKINSNHILFRIEPAEGDRKLTEARADSILTALKGGADLAALSLLYSKDAKTAGKSGDLGWFSPQEMPPDFAGAVRDKKKGEFAEPVRTVFGVHVLCVTDRVYARKITLDEDYDRIQRMALAKKQDEEMKKWVQELAGETYVERKL